MPNSLLKTAALVLTLTCAGLYIWISSEHADERRQAYAESQNISEDQAAFFTSAGSTLIIVLSEDAGNAGVDAIADQEVLSPDVPQMRSIGFHSIQVINRDDSSTATRELP